MYLKTLAIFLLIFLTGCDSIGRQIAQLLPDNKDGASTNLDPNNDTTFVDPTLIGNNKKTTAPIEMTIGGETGAMYGDPTQNPEYREMMQRTDEIGEDPGQQMGAFVGQGEYAAAMTIDEPDTGSTNIDPAAQYQMEVGEFEIPDGGEGADLASQYINQGGVFDPATNPQANQDPTAQYLGNPNGTTRQQIQGGPQFKPRPQGAPKKTLPPSIRPKDTNSKSKNANKTNPPDKPSVALNSLNIKIRVPGIVKPSFATFDSPVAVPQLLDQGTSMSFGVNLQQTSPLPSRGTVYWVIHSETNGFSRFALPVRNGELPPRLQGVVPQFTPSSGSFRTFLVIVNDQNQVQYLTGSTVIPWNP